MDYVGRARTGAVEAVVRPGAKFAPRSCMVDARMRFVVRALLCLFLAVFAVVAPHQAHADPRTGFLVEQLKTSDDYRVRTQAALALGASGDEQAVEPLCEGLADSNVSVRVAAAAALGKLGRASAIPCLDAALKTETAPGVKTQLQKSVANIQAGANGAAAPAKPPPPTKDAKYYVAIEVANKTTRPNDEVEGMVRAAIQTKLLSAPMFAVAPKGETLVQGGQVVAARKLKGFYVIATVEAPIYAGGNLSQAVRLSVLTYPGKSLKGEFSPKLTQTGTPQTDVASETALIKMCTDKAVEDFQKLVGTL